MSALGISGHFAVRSACPLYPRKADMCSAVPHVRFGPEADIARAFILKIFPLSFGPVQLRFSPPFS